MPRRVGKDMGRQSRGYLSVRPLPRLSDTEIVVVNNFQKNLFSAIMFTDRMREDIIWR